MTSPMIFEAFLAELKAEVCRAYGDRLVSLAVFGSVARGTARPDSDVDLLIVADSLPMGRMQRVREFLDVEKALERARAEGVQTYLAPVFKTPAEAARGSPLFLDMVEDARILFDRNDFLAGVLGRLRARLRELGARRVWQGTRWYWDLKPDFRPGEVIEL